MSRALDMELSINTMDKNQSKNHFSQVKQPSGFPILKKHVAGMLLLGLSSSGGFASSVNFELTRVGSYYTVFGGGAEYIHKNGNYLYQGTSPGYDTLPLVTGKTINNCNNPIGGIHIIDVSVASNPQQVGILQAPANTSFGAVRTTTLLNGKDVVSAAINPCYNWQMFPDDSNLNPRVNGKIQGRGGVLLWDVSNPSAPQLLADVRVNRDAASLKRREMVLDAGRNMTDKETSNLNFEQTTNKFGEWAFENADDVGIRTNFFSQDGKDYMVFNTITADTGLVFYDITDPSNAVQVMTYSPHMNYMLQVADICKDVQGSPENKPYKNRYYEELDPVNDNQDRECMQKLANRYWERDNERSFSVASGIKRVYIDTTVALYTDYIASEKAILFSSPSDFIFVSLEDINSPKIKSNLWDRNAFPSLKTPDGSFDLVQYYTLNGQEGMGGYHNSENMVINGKLIVAAAHDMAYTDQTGKEVITTGTSLWDYSKPKKPQLLSFIQSPGEDHEVQFHMQNGVPMIYVTDILQGIKVYDISDLQNPREVTRHAGTFDFGIPGVPPLTWPNPASGFAPDDFANYPDGLRQLNQLVNLPGLPPEYGGLIPYPFISLPFDSYVDEGNGCIYMNTRPGVTHVFKRTLNGADLPNNTCN